MNQMQLQRNVIILLVVVLLLAGLGVLGAMASPRLDGHPLILSPELARETSYLSFVEAQMNTLQRSHEQLAAVLEEADATSNLLEQARRARVATEDALAVLTATEHEVAPPEVAALGQALGVAASDTVEAGRLMVILVNTPTEDAHASAAQALDHAGASLQAVRDLWTRLTPR